MLNGCRVKRQGKHLIEYPLKIKAALFCAAYIYSTVTDFARFLGLSTSLPLSTEV